MRLNATVKVWLGRAGALLSVAGIVFVAQRLTSYAGEIGAIALSLTDWLALIALAVVSGGASLLLAKAWWSLLRWLGVQPDWRWTLWAYATSQLAKYVPGNVMQFAGRQAIGVAGGIANGALFKSTLWELALLCTLALIFAPLAGMRAPLALMPGVAAAGFLMLAVLVLLALGRFGGRRLLQAGLYQFSYLFAASSVFVGCALVAGIPLSPVQLPAVAGAYVLAWLGGLVTPGAPAGLGVREGLLLLLLGPLGDPATILLAVLLGRMVAVIGDAGFFVAGNLMPGARSIR